MLNSISKTLFQSLPYIKQHEGKNFLINFSEKSLTDNNLSDIFNSIQILHSLKINIIICLDIDLKKYQSVEGQINDLEIEKIANILLKFELKLMSGITLDFNTKNKNSDKIEVIKPNLVQVKPTSIIKGLNKKNLGEVHKIKTSFFKQLLDLKLVLLINPIGFSSIGNKFIVENQALLTAFANNCDIAKIINIHSKSEFKKYKSSVKSDSNLILLKDIQNNNHYQKYSQLLQLIKTDCKMHLIDISEHGSLIEELFTTNGKGLLLVKEYIDFFPANDDTYVNEIKQILNPQIDKGFIANYRQIESYINYFYLTKIDSNIVGCCCLIPINKNSAEISFFAVDENYQNEGLGSKLLVYIEKESKAKKISNLYALTINQQEWFTARGYQQISRDKLPKERWVDINRNSIILYKKIK